MGKTMELCFPMLQSDGPDAEPGTNLAIMRQLRERVVRTRTRIHHPHPGLFRLG